MAIGKIEEKQEELAEKEVNTTMGVNFLIIILGSDSPPGMGAKHNVIQLETQRQDIKTKAASNPRGLLLGLCIASVVAVAATTAAAVVVVVIGNKLGSPQFRKKVKFCNCCSTAFQQHHSHS